MTRWTKDRPTVDGTYRVKDSLTSGVIEIKDGEAMLGHVARKSIQGAYFEGCEFGEVELLNPIFR